MINKPSVFIDADACPVKDECMSVAQELGVALTFVASIKNKVNDEKHANWVYVDWGKEAADLHIMNSAEKGDLAVTADIGLAAALIGKGVCVLSPKGILYDEGNIDRLLLMRHEAAKKRRNGVYSKGPKAFTKADRKNFREALFKNLSKLAGK
ncbi:YaiI/YqxD family protein [Bacillus testis]|uniref:YaiI/YqxD family protein n=1 Tax=Bacillus testis TaxID=1622072 RepID=UPI00067E6D07|nr:YaiI/YqxD family protein [Bacillus testis]